MADTLELLLHLERKTIEELQEADEPWDYSTVIKTIAWLTEQSLRLGEARIERMLAEHHDARRAAGRG
jgi:hypothetical protein